MKILHLGTCILLAAATAGIAHAGSDQAGTTAANFLSIGTGPDILGRGGATLGLRGEICAVPWNPGALGFLRETQIALSHAALTEDHAQEYFGAGGRLGRSDARWALSGLYESEGSFEGRDALNNPTGTFTVSSFAGGGHVAYPIAGLVSVGAGAKWVTENLGSSRGSGVTFDAGVQMHAGMFGAGFAAQNMLGSMRFAGTSYDFPTNYGVGIALDHAETGLRLALDANFPTAYYDDVRAGLEWRWRDMIAVRGGYRSEISAPSDETLSGPSFGFGAGVYGMWLDYSYVVPANGGAQQRIGVTLRPGRMNFGGGPMGDFEPAAAPPATSTSSTSPSKPIHAYADPQPTEQPKSESQQAAPPAQATPSASAAAPSSAPAPASAQTSVAPSNAVPAQAAQAPAQASKETPRGPGSVDPAHAHAAGPPVHAIPAQARASVQPAAAAPAKPTTPEAVRPQPAAPAQANPSAAAQTQAQATPAAPVKTQAQPSSRAPSSPEKSSASVAEAKPEAKPVAENKTTPKRTDKKTKAAKAKEQAKGQTKKPSKDPFDDVIERAKNMKPGDVVIK